MLRLCKEGRSLSREFEPTGRRFDPRFESRWAFHRKIGQQIHERRSQRAMPSLAVSQCAVARAPLFTFTFTFTFICHPGKTHITLWLPLLHTSGFTSVSK